MRAANRKQAMVPRGATILEPVGTAPGLVVPPADGRSGPTVRGAPGPAARAAADVGARRSRRTRCGGAIGGRTEFRQEMLRLFGIPESEIAETLRRAEADGVDLDGARDHDLPAARRGRDRHALPARGAAASTTRSRPCVRERHARHALLR